MMSPEQALETVATAAGLAALPKRDHIAIEQAVEVLRDAIKSKPDPQPETVSDK